MSKRIKKPPVKLEQRQDWLERYELGESPPKIARSDGFDIRTVRKHIEQAKQEREVKEARSMVLRNALERHYKDMCDYAQRLDSEIAGQTVVSWSLHDEQIRAALRQHLPRSPIWAYLNQYATLPQQITELKDEAGKKLGEAVASDSRLSPVLSTGEMGVIPGIIVALSLQIEQWPQGISGLNLEYNLIQEPAEEGFVNLRYGPAQMGKVKKEHVTIIREVLQDWESRLKDWEEFRKLERCFVELRRVKVNMRDELAVIILRRIVPGRCKYCPL